MRVYLASDHAGFELKQALLAHLLESGHSAEDLGPHAFDPSDDYPDLVMPLAERVAREAGSFGIVLGASGQGEAMAANRVKGARAAVYYGGAGRMQTDAQGQTLGLLASTREHNDANILSLGARFIGLEEAKHAVDAWLAQPFSGDERHMRRIRKLDA